MQNESEWLSERQSCPDCDSSRGLATKTDGTTYCHSCGETNSNAPFTPPKERSKALANLIPPDSITCAAIDSRGLTRRTAEHFGYGLVEHKGEVAQVAQWFNSAGAVVAQKVRKKDKDFFVLGDSKQMRLFGENRADTTSERLVITEGELDAMAVSQVFGNSWPVVSVPNGASNAAKAIKNSLQFVSKFPTVVLAFDNDEAGAAAVEECLPLFRPGTVRVANLPLKDACDMLAAGRGEELKKCVWNAKLHMPGGIISGEDAWDKIVNEKFVAGTPYNFEGIQERLKGIRKGELIMLTSATGSGKSTYVRQLAGHLALNSPHKVGMASLEENVRQTSLNIYGTELGRPMLPISEDLPIEDLAGVHARMGHKLCYVDHFGSTESGELLSKIRFMVVGLGCEVIIFDHISIAISGMETDNERKAIDLLMTGLRSLVEETGCAMIVISHLRKPGDGSFEEGKPISLNDLRGSGTLSQIPDIVVALERDQQAEDEELRNTSLVRILKNRPAAWLGVAARLKYEQETGRLVEVPLASVAAAYAEAVEDFS